MFAITSSSLASSGPWEWINPKPQGNPLFGVYFLNRDTGFCVGDVGTIIRTTDGGKTWDVKTCVTGSDLNRVYFPNHGTIGYAVGDSGTILKTTNSGESWFQQQSNYSDVLLGVHFPVSDQIGYVAGAGVVLKTTDGGGHWNPTGQTPFFLADVWFVGNDTGWAVGFGSVLLKTTDGGGTWTQNMSVAYSGQDFLSVQFPLGTSVGFIAGGNSVDPIIFPLWKTRDGGQTWTTLSDPFLVVKHKLCFPQDTATGYVVGEAGGILKTTDGGASWLRLSGGGDVGNLYDVTFVSREAGYAIGDNGAILKTTDGGTTWTNFLHSLGNTIDWYFSRTGQGFIVGGDGLLLRTLDFGESWDTIGTGITNTLRVIKFPSDGVIGYTAGDNTVLKTIDRGSTWTALPPPRNSSFTIYSSAFPMDADTGFVSGGIGPPLWGPIGFIERTTDGGLHWREVLKDSTVAIDKLSFPPQQSKIGYALTGQNVGGGVKGVYKTTDGGNNWFLRYNNPGYGLNDLEFPSDPDIGFIPGNGRILKTTDGGSMWFAIDSANYGYKSIYFPDGGQSGYAGGGNNLISRTNDGGLTWTRLCMGTSSVDKIYFPYDTLLGFIGLEGTILRTMTGGYPTSVHGRHGNIPRDYTLFQNYPNPFNPSTVIEFDLPHAGRVELTVYNILGERIAEVLSGIEQVGRHKVQIHLSSSPSGAYFYQLKLDDLVRTRKMILLK